MTDPFVRRLLYTVLVNSKKGRSTPLAKNFLGRFQIKNPIDPNDRGHKWICEALSKALGVQYREYSNQHHIARSIQIDPEYAAQLLDEWHSFKIDPSDPSAINSATLEPTAGMSFDRIIRTSKRVVTQSVSQRFHDYPLPELLRDINHAKLPESLFDRFKIVGADLEARQDAAATDVERRSLQRRLVYMREAERNAKTGYIYEPAPPAYRLYVREASLQGIDREDRRALTRQCDGYYELDLRNAHFAIVGALAESGEMNALLDAGSIWDQLLDWCGLDDGWREQLKAVVTSSLYGAGDARRLVMLEQDERKKVAHTLMLETFKAKTDSPRALSRQRYAQDQVEVTAEKHARATLARLMSHPAMVAMDKARKELERRIRSDDGMVDGFGRFVAIPQGRKIGTVMHAVATSWERLLIDVIYQRARRNKFGDFRVILDQHDGVTIHFSRRDPKRSATVIKNLQEDVRAAALALGVNTSLEVKNSEEKPT